MVDRDRVLAKLTYLDAQIVVLQRVAQAQAPDDPLLVSGTRYAIQTAIESLIDICFHVSAKVARHLPQGAHDALNAAVAGTGVDSARLHRWHDMIGLRNRLVHGYEEVDNQRLLASLPEGIVDLQAFVQLAKRAWLAGA